MKLSQDTNANEWNHARKEVAYQVQDSQKYQQLL